MLFEIPSNPNSSVLMGRLQDLFGHLKYGKIRNTSCVFKAEKVLKKHCKHFKERCVDGAPHAALRVTGGSRSVCRKPSDKHSC